MNELITQVFHRFFYFLLWLIHFFCVFVLARKESQDIVANIKLQPFVFLAYKDLLGALEIYFHDSLLEWHICHFQFTLRVFAYAFVSVRVCRQGGVPAGQFPLTGKVRRRYLGDVMKDLQGNSRGSCQSRLIVNVYSLKVFRSPAVQGICVCTYACVYIRVRVFMCANMKVNDSHCV